MPCRRTFAEIFRFFPKNSCFFENVCYNTVEKKIKEIQKTGQKFGLRSLFGGVFLAEQKGKAKNIAGRVREAVEPLVLGAGYSLWDVTFYKEAAEFILEVAIDKEGGISTDDCSVVTKLVDPLLDEMDPIDESYCLMVSGAGATRELCSDAHLEFAVTNGYPVTLKTFVSSDGKKQFDGVLVAYDGDSVTLKVGEEEKRFERKQVAKMTVECEGSISE